MSNISIWPTDRTLSGSSTPGQSTPRSGGNEGVLHIPQSFSITGSSLSDCLVLYSGHSLAAEMQPVYSETLADWTTEVAVPVTVPSISQ